MKSLQITWQRLVDSQGQTCDRCNSTYESLKEAVSKLEEVLSPLNIEVTLETIKIDRESFKTDPSQSNRIWIAGKPIEEWLGATITKTPCCSVCGDAKCRTIELGSDRFEAIPSDLIVKAALVAVSQLI
ncbi:heavy metal sensor signal transduction histidine kinase [Vibrio albus]|uniref:Heavy metal sensor signal transduction histidine kinase n=1 Tax=Vibrio albus TaxID=2200953 RepID=A0A2U3B970_9VIBR|nr:DUF2703 domain-containing protein [Vibrio albus]PWI33340.1 heavy metal sensor signal transduction histidine kinase [Vibrio albus]